MRTILPYVFAKEELTTFEKVGQLFMPAAFINDSEEEIQKLETLIREHHVGGLCFFHSRASAATNYEGDSAKEKVLFNENSLTTLKQLIKRYQAIAKYPLLISIDAEWGLAMRVENTPQYPYAITLGAIKEREDLLFEVGKHIAKDCKATGIHWNLAPVVDINNNPDNPVIGYRSFGGDREAVYRKAKAFIKGTQSEGVLTSIKHFPGHGDTSTDSHLGLPEINKTRKALLENELYPFQKLIKEGVDAVMVGHLSVPSLSGGQSISSSISKNVIKGFLREKMGFGGVVISDALNMHAVSKDYGTKGELEWLAFDAGTDILCFSEHPKEGIGTILKNADPSDIEEGFQRVWKLKEKAFASQIPALDQNPTLLDPAGLNQKLAAASITFLKGSQKEVANFREQPFLGIDFSQNIDNPFFDTIQANKRFPTVSSKTSTLAKIADLAGNHKNILMSVSPPSVKPTNQFGIPEEALRLMNMLLRRGNSLLYLFGNPYVLNHLDIQHTLGVVVAYQDFGEFQQVAAQHFLGTLECQGILPITLHKNYENI